MEKQPEGLDAFTIDADNLYREESITDLKAQLLGKWFQLKLMALPMKIDQLNLSTQR